MPDNPHFEFPDSLTEAASLLEFDPLTPKAPRLTMNSIAVFVREAGRVASESLDAYALLRIAESAY